MLLSIVIPTKNEEKNIRRIIQSITKNPEYHPEKVEIIVVDNTKTSDNTAKIVSETPNVRLFAKGPERSAQRNCGAEHSKGEILLFLDADMMLSNSKRNSQGIIKEIFAFYKDPAYKNYALVIPERVTGKSIYARARNLEKQIYSNNKTISAARVYPKELFLKIKGFNESMVSGEDWDLDRRFRKNGGVVEFTKNYIIHNEKDLGFVGSLKKKAYYARKLIDYKVGIEISVNPFYRIGILFTKPLLIVKQPLAFLYLITLKLCEFAVGFYAYTSKRASQ